MSTANLRLLWGTSVLVTENLYSVHHEMVSYGSVQGGSSNFSIPALCSQWISFWLSDLSLQKNGHKYTHSVNSLRVYVCMGGCFHCGWVKDCLQVHICMCVLSGCECWAQRITKGCFSLGAINFIIFRQGLFIVLELSHTSQADWLIDPKIYPSITTDY